ncbi:UNVERIFIED_CONTAM: hypothetical protein JM85_1545 [Acetobacter peroxydans]
MSAHNALPPGKPIQRKATRKKRGVCLAAVFVYFPWCHAKSFPPDAPAFHAGQDNHNADKKHD